MADQIRSVLRAFELLRLLAAAGEPVPLAVLAERAELPKSTTRRLLATLGSVRAVEPGIRPGTYVSGRGLAAIGGYGAVQPVIHALAGPFLGDVVSLTGEDATLAVLDQDTVVFTEQLTGPHPIQVPDATGARFAPHTVSSGFVLMSAWSDDRIERYLAEIPQAKAAEKAALRHKIRETGKRGYVWHIDGWVEGISAVAVPVKAGDGSLVAALGAFGPTYRFPGALDLAELGRAMTRIGTQLGSYLSRS